MIKRHFSSAEFVSFLFVLWAPHQMQEVNWRHKEVIAILVVYCFIGVSGWNHLVLLSKHDEPSLDGSSPCWG